MPLGKPLSATTRQNMKKPHPTALKNQNSRKMKWAPPGMSTHPLFQCYYQMIKKCTNPKHDKYEYFGAKGITVCERWLEPDGQGFINFLTDMGNRPLSYNLERNDTTKNYEPSNCVWRDPNLCLKDLIAIEKE